MKRRDACFVVSPTFFPCETAGNLQNLCQCRQPSDQHYNRQTSANEAKIIVKLLNNMFYFPVISSGFCYYFP